MGWVKGGVLLSADVKNKKTFDRLPTILFRGPHNETSPRLVIGITDYQVFRLWVPIAESLQDFLK